MQSPKFDLWNYYIRELAITLNRLCFMEVFVITLFCYLSIDLLMWYKSIMTVDKFDSLSFWGAITGIVATIFTAVKSINDTHKNGK